MIAHRLKSGRAGRRPIDPTKAKLISSWSRRASVAIAGLLLAAWIAL